MKTDALKKYWADVRAGLREHPKREKQTSVTRKVRVESHFVRDRTLIVVLHDHGELELREPRRLGAYKISLAQCYTIAAKNAANQQMALVKKYRKEEFLTLAEARRKARRSVLGV